MEILVRTRVVSGDGLAKEEIRPTKARGLGAASSPICR
jgi:hypothetical protein